MTGKRKCERKAEDIGHGLADEERKVLDGGPAHPRALLNAGQILPGTCVVALKVADLQLTCKQRLTRLPVRSEKALSPHLARGPEDRQLALEGWQTRVFTVRGRRVEGKGHGRRRGRCSRRRTTDHKQIGKRRFCVRNPDRLPLLTRIPLDLHRLRNKDTFYGTKIPPLSVAGC